MSVELAEVLRRHAPSYLAEYGGKILPGHRRAIHDVMACRTPALGGQAWWCEPCGTTHYSYHSCNNRNCPKCGNDDASDWLERQQSLLLPVPHFLITVTVPAELRPCFKSNQIKGYSLLMKASAEGIQALCADPRHLGARPGLIAILHTWTRKLTYHPHVHFLVTGGGYCRKQNQWIHSRPDYLLPERALAAFCRGRFKAILGKTAHHGHIPPQAWEKNWGMKIIPVGSGEPTLKYFARYVFRTALGAKKIVSCDDRDVTFRYTESKTKLEKTETLPAHAFLHRYLQHVLPRGFTRVRYYGVFAPGNRKKLETVRRILRVPREEETTAKTRPEPTEPKPFCCPKCQKPMTPGQRFRPGQKPP